MLTFIFWPITIQTDDRMYLAAGLHALPSQPSLQEKCSRLDGIGMVARCNPQIPRWVPCSLTLHVWSSQFT